MKIFIASGNEHKIIEIRNILNMSFKNLNLELESIANLDIPEPDEPYTTFMENACHKAKYYSKFINTPTMSEDSGLCIEALNNFPGVRTKDFMIDSGNLNNAYNNLEKMLKDHHNYSAHFVCAMAVHFPDENRFITYQARYNGKMSFPARGDKCFAFDPVFSPQGYDQTMAELGEEIKNKIGHRALAVRGIINQLIHENFLHSDALI